MVPCFGHILTYIPFTVKGAQLLRPEGKVAAMRCLRENARG